MYINQIVCYVAGRKKVLERKAICLEDGLQDLSQLPTLSTSFIRSWVLSFCFVLSHLCNVLNVSTTHYTHIFYSLITGLIKTKSSKERKSLFKGYASWKMTPLFADLPKTLLFHSRICMQDYWTLISLDISSQTDFYSNLSSRFSSCQSLSQAAFILLENQWQ